MPAIIAPDEWLSLRFHIRICVKCTQIYCIWFINVHLVRSSLTQPGLLQLWQIWFPRTLFWFAVKWIWAFIIVLFHRREPDTTRAMSWANKIDILDLWQTGLTFTPHGVYYHPLEMQKWCQVTLDCTLHCTMKLLCRPIIEQFIADIKYLAFYKK